MLQAMNEPKLIDPERLDLPSASDAYARRRCLGRYQLIRHLKATGQLAELALLDSRAADGRYAAFGDRIHAAWAGQQIALEGFERETLEKMLRLEQMLLSDWAAGREVAIFAREQRIWLHNGITPLHSGRYDVAYTTVNFDSMLIIDGKTLTHPVAPADTNDQLRELVALAHFNYPAIKSFTVAIIQPNVERPTSIATYDELESELALRLLRWHLSDICARDLPRIYGDWCVHCPALPFCPEAKAAIEPISAYQLERDSENKLVLPIGQPGAEFLRRLVLAKTLCETIVAAYRAYLEQHPDDLPGWTLKPGKTKRAITEVHLALNALAESISLEQFLDCTNVSIGKLQTAFGASTGLKGKALRDSFNARLGEILEFNTDAPSLEDTES